jgi:hypothetical protein
MVLRNAGRRPGLQGLRAREPDRFKYQAGAELLLEVQTEAKAHQVARKVC